MIFMTNLDASEEGTCSHVHLHLKKQLKPQREVLHSITKKKINHSVSSHQTSDYFCLQNTYIKALFYILRLQEP